MDLSHFALLTILSLFLCGVPEAKSWRWNEDRSDGYDLQRGPVFYEAYYPDEQAQTSPVQQPNPVNPQAEVRYANRGNVVEKTYQSLGSSPYGTANQRDSRELQNNPELSRDRRRQSADSPGSFPNSVNESDLPLNHHTNVEARKATQDLRRLVDDLEQIESLRNSGTYRIPEVEVAATNLHYPFAGRIYRDNSETLIDNPERRLDDSLNIVLAALKDGELRISDRRAASFARHEENSRFSNREGSLESNDFRRSDTLERNPKANFEPLNQPITSGVSGLQKKRNEGRTGSFDRGSNDQLDHAFGNDYEDVRVPISGPIMRPMENIFQPRPQVISYVFSPTKTLTIATNVPVGVDNTKEVKSSEAIIAGVASIEVSEVPHHKIRHHHGEKPRRHHHHRQNPNENLFSKVRTFFKNQFCN